MCINARIIAEALTTQKDKINHKTVSSYIDHLCNAFAFYKIRRCDIHGKKYLASNDKYYLSDYITLKRNEKIYIQVSDDIGEEKTFAREIYPLLSIEHCSESAGHFLLAP